MGKGQEQRVGDDSPPGALNTDAEGYYGEGREEYPPRLYGWMRTDAAGRFELHTILPGHYPGMHVPAHVHFTVWGGSYPPQWVGELRFEGDQYITAEMLAGTAARATSARFDHSRIQKTGFCIAASKSGSSARPISN